MAANFAGVRLLDFQQWLALGNGEVGRGRPREPFASLARDVAEAEGAHATEMLLAVRSAAIGTKDRPGDWKAAAWVLSHRYVEDFGDRVRHEGHDGGAVKTETSVRGELGVNVQTTATLRIEVEERMKLPEGTLEAIGRQVAGALSASALADLAAQNEAFDSELVET